VNKNIGRGGQNYGISPLPFVEKAFGVKLDYPISSHLLAAGVLKNWE